MARATDRFSRTCINTVTIGLATCRSIGTTLITTALVAAPLIATTLPATSGSTTTAGVGLAVIAAVHIRKGVGCMVSIGSIWPHSTIALV